MNKTVINQSKFENLVMNEARRLHNRFLRMGVFWPIQICKSESRKKLKPYYVIVNNSNKKSS